MFENYNFQDYKPFLNDILRLFLLFHIPNQNIIFLTIVNE